MTPTPEQQLAEWIKQFKWKSVDKDNMEFELRTTCYVKDALDAWAAAAGVDPLKAWDSGFEEAVKRCTQWLEYNYPSAKTIALEMRRALKDKP